MAKIVLLLGGVRSGKSEYAEKLALSFSDKVAYIATGTAIDEEMKRRIDAHKKRRPKSWKTYEIGEDNIEVKKVKQIFSSIVEEKIKVVLIDCITNLLFGIISKYELDKEDVITARTEEEIEKKVVSFFDDFLEIMRDVRESGLNIIIVSNEVGLGIVPFYPLGRIFRDLMGTINKKIAQSSDEVYFFVAGLKQRVK